MKTGTNLQQMVWQLQKQETVAKDYTLSAPLVSMEMGLPLPQIPTDSQALDELLQSVATDFDGQPMVGPGVMPVTDEPVQRIPLIQIDGGRILQGNRIFHQQLASQLSIPYTYYQRQFRQHPEDLAKSVNSWLQDTEVVRNVERPVHGKRTVRTLGNIGRAFLSQRYRRLDNYPLIMACMTHLFELGITEEDVVSCMVTDQKMYLKVVTPKLEGDVGKGDIVQAGLEITNSEVGRGALSVRPLVFRLVCLNGAVMADTGLRKTHIGSSQMGDEENGWEIYSDETMKLADQAFFAEVGDVIAHTLSEEVFDLNLEKMRAANSDEIVTEIPTVVERMATTYQFSESEQDTILSNFIGGKTNTRWGMANAVTLSSQSDDISYERASEMERIGGKIIEDDNTWHGIALIN
jgi:hypothetical protein